MILVGLWAWTDIEVKRLQVYPLFLKLYHSEGFQYSITLSRMSTLSMVIPRRNTVSCLTTLVHSTFGIRPSPPLLCSNIDGAERSNFIVWIKAAVNKHYLVALTSLMAIVALSFQPLAAALLVLRDTWTTHPDMLVSNLQEIGLNQNQQFQDLTSACLCARRADLSDG